MDLENNTTVNKLFITINPTLRLFQHAFTIILKKLYVRAYVSKANRWCCRSVTPAQFIGGEVPFHANSLINATTRPV